MNLYDYLNATERENSGSASSATASRCKCGGALEKIAETKLEQERFLSSKITNKTIYHGCTRCDALYRATETVYLHDAYLYDDARYPVEKFLSATEPYEGLLTKQELIVHAPTLRGTITAANERIILLVKAMDEKHRRTK